MTGVLWVVLYVAYREIVAPSYGYLDMGWVDPDPAMLAMNVLTLLLCSLFLPRTIRVPSSFVVWALFVFLAVGASFVPLVSGRVQGADSWIVTALACGAILIVRMVGLGQMKAPNKPALSARSYLQLIFVSTIVVNVLVFSFAGFSLEMPGIDEIYDARLAFRQVIESLPAFVGYAMPVAANVLNPLVLLLAVHTRRFWMAAVVLVFQMALYSIDGQKMILLLPAAVIGVYLLARWRKPVTARFLVALVAIMVVVVSLGATGSGRVVFEVAVRRLMLIPAQLLGAYYDYFGSFGFAHLQHSRFFNAGVLTPEPGYLIGQYVFGSNVQNANASFISDGFANFGVLGVIGAAVICGLILRAIDSFTLGAPTAVALAAMSPVVIILSNNALQTALLTSGLFVLLVLLYLLPTDLAHQRPAAAERETQEQRHRPGKFVSERPL
ncbi:hypothetical protein MHM582_0671 [Microbacterium sp. HM58-2]|nr:hypothetical protein MHM582_0671 [Microbacterium sp. HM58-2]